MSSLSFGRPASSFRAKMYSPGGIYTSSMAYLRHRVPCGTVLVLRRKSPRRSFIQVFGRWFLLATARTAVLNVRYGGEVVVSSISLRSTSTSCVEGLL